MPPASESMIQSGLVRRLAASLRLVIVGSFILAGLFGLLFLLVVRAADKREHALLAAEFDRAAETVAEVLRPVLRTATPGDVMVIADAMAPYASPDRALGLFFTPADGGAPGVYFIAGAPAQVFGRVEGESARLVNTGAFGDMSAACVPARRDAAAADATSLWAVVPIAGVAGCWRLIAHRALAGVGPRFAALPEVRAVGIAAAAAALLMIAAALLALAQARLLRRVADVAHAYAEIAAVDDTGALPQPANDQAAAAPVKPVRAPFNAACAVVDAVRTYWRAIARAGSDPPGTPPAGRAGRGPARLHSVGATWPEPPSVRNP